MKLPPKSSSGAHHLDDLVLALKRAGIGVSQISDSIYQLETDDAGPLVMLFPPMVGSALVQQLMEHFGSDENSFLPFLIELTKKRQH